MIDLAKLSDDELSTIKTKLVSLTNQKLTNWKQEPSIHDLKHDLTQAQASQANYLSKLAYWEKLYNAPKFGGKEHKGSRVVPKLVRKQAEWAIPALTEPFLSTEDLFDVKPLTFDDVDRARQNALILNRQFSVQLNKTALVDKIVRQLIKRGACIVRVGWEYREVEKEVEVEQFQYSALPMLNIDPQMAQEMGILDPSQELQNKYNEMAQLQQTNPDSYEQLPSELKAGFEMSQEKGQLLQATSIGFVKEKQKKVVCNKPAVQICKLKNIYIDPTCGDEFEKAQFIIYANEMSLSDLIKQGIYKNLNTITHTQTEDTINSGFVFKDLARKKVTVYEYWGYWDTDGNGLTRPIVASWVGDTLIRLDENPFPDGKLPFVVFNYIPEEDNVCGIPNAELLGDNQEILGAVTRGMIDLMGKSANSQTGFAKNFLDSTNKEKFRRGMDYEYNNGFDPRVHTHTHKYPEIPQSAMAMVQMMNNEAESLSGVKAFSGTGISASNLGDVAAGVRGVLDAVSKREMSILRRISAGFIELGRKIIAMNAEFLSEEEVVRVTNSEFVTIRRDDLAGEYDLSLSISTAEADDAKAKEISFMMQTIANNQDRELNQMMLAEVFDLRKMPHLAEQVRNYKPEPDPFQQEMQQLELEYKKAEIELMKAEVQERLAKSQVQSAKVGTEQAKAESLQGDVHNKAYEMASKEMGITDEKENAKQQMANQHELDKQALSHNQALETLLAEQTMNDMDNEYAQYQQLGLNQ